MVGTDFDVEEPCLIQINAPTEDPRFDDRCEDSLGLLIVIVPPLGRERSRNEVVVRRAEPYLPSQFEVLIMEEACADQISSTMRALLFF